MYRLHNLWMILYTIYRAKYIIWTISHHGIHKSHWDIDVTWMDINMDINICMKASYFGSSDLTVKCKQSKEKILACRSNVLFKLISLWLDRKYKSTNKFGMKLVH